MEKREDGALAEEGAKGSAGGLSEAREGVVLEKAARRVVDEGRRRRRQVWQREEAERDRRVGVEDAMVDNQHVVC